VLVHHRKPGEGGLPKELGADGAAVEELGGASPVRPTDAAQVEGREAGAAAELAVQTAGALAAGREGEEDGVADAEGLVLDV
jgi:hypothetical protein